MCIFQLPNRNLLFPTNKLELALFVVIPLFKIPPVLPPSSSVLQPYLSSLVHLPFPAPSVVLILSLSYPYRPYRCSPTRSSPPPLSAPWLFWLLRPFLLCLFCPASPVPRTSSVLLLLLSFSQLADQIGSPSASLPVSGPFAFAGRPQLTFPLPATGWIWPPLLRRARTCASPTATAPSSSLSIPCR